MNSLQILYCSIIHRWLLISLITPLSVAEISEVQEELPDGLEADDTDQELFDGPDQEIEEVFMLRYKDLIK